LVKGGFSAVFHRMGTISYESTRQLHTKKFTVSEILSPYNISNAFATVKLNTCAAMLTFMHPNGVIVMWLLVSFGHGLYKESC
jgi:hypothetical protein